MPLLEPRERLTRMSPTQRELRSQSIHNIYPEMQERDIKPVKRYVKTALSIKSFRRLNPTTDKREVVEGLLRTSMDNQDNPIWRYDNEVIELYSEREVRFFESYNGSGDAINDGSLEEYD